MMMLKGLIGVAARGRGAFRTVPDVLGGSTAANTLSSAPPALFPPHVSKNCLQLGKGHGITDNLPL